MIGNDYHFIDEDFVYRQLPGPFVKFSGSSASHLMAAKMPIIWGNVKPFAEVTDCAAEMVKLGRILSFGKPADKDGPALPALGLEWSG